MSSAVIAAINSLSIFFTYLMGVLRPVLGRALSILRNALRLEMRGPNFRLREVGKILGVIALTFPALVKLPMSWYSNHPRFNHLFQSNVYSIEFQFFEI